MSQPFDKKVGKRRKDAKLPVPPPARTVVRKLRLPERAQNRHRHKRKQIVRLPPNLKWVVKRKRQRPRIKLAHKKKDTPRQPA